MKKTLYLFGSSIIFLTSCVDMNNEKTYSDQIRSKKPIGYYLKTADNLLTEGINAIHKDLNITRTDWQILNSVQENPNIKRDDVAQLISEFTSYDEANQIIDALIERGILSESQSLSLTEEGKKLYQDCFERQTEFRLKATQNISEKEYIQTIETLEKIIENLR